MAVLDIIFAPVSRAYIGTVRLDVSESEQHEFAVTVTKEPVESGQVIADNAWSQPFKITINGEITDTPVRLLSGVRSSVLEGQQPAGLLGGTVFPNTELRSVSAYRALVSLMELKQPITIVTGLARYSNMVLTSLRVLRNAQIGRVLSVSIQAEQVRIVQLTTRLVEKISKKDSTQQRAQGKADRGKQPVKRSTSALLNFARQLAR